MSNNLTPEQQALFDSIMGNSSQMRNLHPVIEIPKPEEVLDNEQQDLYNSIMGKSVQMQNYNPMAALGEIAPSVTSGQDTARTAAAPAQSVTTSAPAASSFGFASQSAPAPSPSPAMDSGKKLSQSEIDALIASMLG